MMNKISWDENQPALKAGTSWKWKDKSADLFYGRQYEMEQLYQCIVQAFQDNNTAFIQVEGEGGVGKTSLVQQVLKKGKTDHCFQLYGKHDQRLEKIPYFGLKQALHQWMEFLLTLHDQEFETLKSAVRRAVGVQHTVLTSVFEELELLLGKSTSHAPETVSADPQKVRQQFTYFFQKFLASLAECGYATVLFLDDLQWADRATLDLIYDLVTAYDIPGLLIIGANRPLPAPVEHPKLLHFLQHEKVVRFEVKPLERNAIQCFIPEEWQLQAEEAIAFEEYLTHESEGNPFVALEIIDFIRQEHLVNLHAVPSPALSWDQLPKLRQNANVIHLVQHKLNGLSPLSREMVMTASCLGFYFSCKMLAELLSLQQETFGQGMHALEEQHFLFRQGDQCFFIHDNIHAAAYTMVGDRKSEMHLMIARYLEALTQLDVQHPCFFDTINHFNLAVDKITDPSQLLKLAALNWLAARLAMQKSAFDRALDYFQRCASLLPEDAGLDYRPVWENDALFAYEWLPQPFPYQEFYVTDLLGIAECQFLIHQYENSLATLEKVLAVSQDRFTLLQANTIKMKIFIAVINRQDLPRMLLDGVQITEKVLEQYQVYLPQDKNKYFEAVSLMYDKVKEKLLAHDPDWFYTTEVSTDREFNDLIRFIVHTLPIIFFADVNKAKYLSLAGLYLCLQKGFTPAVPALFASSVWPLSMLKKDYEVGSLLGDIALKLIEKEEYRSVAHLVYHMGTLNFYNWKHHYREGIKRLDEATQLSLEAGDYNYVVFCATNARLLEIFMGTNLKEHAYAQPNKKVRSLHVHFVNRCYMVLVPYLTGQKPGFTEGRLLFPKTLKKETEYNLNCRYHFHHAKEKLFFLSGQYHKAYRYGKVCESLEQVYDAFQVGIEHNFIYSLTLLQLMYQYPDREKAYLPVVQRKWKELDRLAALGSGNYLHKQWLVEAEMAKCQGQIMEAMRLYDQAIAEAVRTGFVNVAAMAAELAGKYMLSLAREKLAVPYLKEAYRYYAQWGADAKLRWLEMHYPDQLKEEIEAYQQAQAIYQQTGSSLTDITTVYQATMALSKELKVNDLIVTLLRIAMNHVKAKRGIFLLKNAEGWKIMAAGDGQKVTLLSQYLTDNSPLVPHKLINYVLRKKEKVWLQEPLGNKIFREHYFEQHPVKVAVGVPIIHHQEVVALLYLEKSNYGEKSPQLQVMDTMASQAAISLTNAFMYEDLQRLNQELQRQEQRRIEAIIETQEKERKRVAEELHDNLGQMLSLVKLNFSRLEDQIAGDKALFLDTSHYLDESCVELRKIAHNIMPPDFEKKNLVEILEALLRKQVPASGLAYHFDHYQVPGNIPVAVKFNLYRVVQEILTNITKHAQATEITLQLIGNDGGLDVMVEDNGKGFDVHFNTEGLGLQNIHSRINLLKGSVEVDSSLQRGTIYNIHLPLS